jgi:hypothetical protein
VRDGAEPESDKFGNQRNTEYFVTLNAAEARDSGPAAASRLTRPRPSTDMRIRKLLLCK